MAIPPSGEYTTLTREEYVRLREEEAQQPPRKRAMKRHSSISKWDIS